METSGKAPNKQLRFLAFKETFKQQLLTQAKSGQVSPQAEGKSCGHTNSQADSHGKEEKKCTTETVEDSIHYCRPVQESRTGDSPSMNPRDSMFAPPIRISQFSDSMLAVPNKTECSLVGGDLEPIWIRGPGGKKERAFIRQRVGSHGVGLPKIEIMLGDSTLITGITVAPGKQESRDCKEIILADGCNSRILILKDSTDDFEAETPTLKPPSIQSMIVQSSIMEPDFEPIKTPTISRGFAITSECTVSLNGIYTGKGVLNLNTCSESPVELLPALLIANADNYELVLVKVFSNGSKILKTSDLHEQAFSAVSEEVHQIDCMATRFIQLRRSALHLPGRIVQPDCLCIFEQGVFNIEPISFLTDEEATLKLETDSESRKGVLSIIRSKSTSGMTISFKQLSSPTAKESASPAVSQFFVSIKESTVSHICLTPKPIENATNLNLAISAVLQKWQSLVGVQLKKSVRPQLIHSGTFEFEGLDFNKIAGAESVLLAVVDPSKTVAQTIKESLLVNTTKSNSNAFYQPPQPEKKPADLSGVGNHNNPNPYRPQNPQVLPPIAIRYSELEQEKRPVKPAFATSSMFAEDVRQNEVSAGNSLEKQMNKLDYFDDRRISFGELTANPKLSVFQSMVYPENKHELDNQPEPLLKLTISDKEGNQILIYGKENSSVHSSELSDSMESDSYFPTDEIYTVEAGEKLFVSEFKKLKQKEVSYPNKKSKFKHLKVVQVRSKQSKGPRFETGNMEYPKIPNPSAGFMNPRLATPTTTQTPGRHLRKRGHESGYAPTAYVSSTGDTYNWNPLVKKPPRVLSPPDSEIQHPAPDDFGSGLYEPGEVEAAEQSFKKVQAALKRRNSEAPSSNQFSASDKPSSISDYQSKNQPHKTGLRFMETIDKLGIGKKKEELEKDPIHAILGGHVHTMSMHQKKNSDGMLGTLISSLHAETQVKKGIPDKPTLEVPKETDLHDCSDQLSKRIRSSRKSSRSRSLDRPELLNSQDNEHTGGIGAPAKLGYSKDKLQYVDEQHKHNDSVLGSDLPDKRPIQLPGLASPLPSGSKLRLVIETPDGGRTELLCVGSSEEVPASSKTIGFQANQIPKRMDTIRSEASVQFSLKAFNILPQKMREPHERFSKKYSGHNLMDSVRQLRQIEKEVGSRTDTGSDRHTEVLERLQGQARTLQH